MALVFCNIDRVVSFLWIEERKILDDVSGFVEAGELVGIIGHTGAGKTSLLKVLAGRDMAESGCVKLNSRPLDNKLIASEIGYVRQHDLLFPTLTVKETLDVAAQLRLHFTSKDEKKRVLKDVLSRPRLNKAQDTMVEVASGGEQKRVAIGQVLVYAPSVLLADEPTTGLDAAMAFEVVSILRQLSNVDACEQEGRAVVCTIHQPRSNIFSLFDRVLLLHQGRVVYWGTPVEVCEHFAPLGYECPSHTNPGDFMVDVLLSDSSVMTQYASTSVADRTDVERVESSSVGSKHSVGETLVSAFPDTSAGLVFYQRLEELKHAEPATAQFESRADGSRKNASFFKVFRVLFNRARKNMLRNRANIGAVIGGTLFLSLLFVQSAFIIFDSCLSSNWSVWPRDCTFRGCLIQNSMEHRTDLARVCVETPFKVFVFVLEALIVYFWVGLRAELMRFARHTLALVLTSQAGVALMIAIGAAVPSEDVGFIVAPLLTIVLVLASGFIIVGDLNALVTWVPWISPLRYGWDMMMRTELAGLSFTCDTEACRNGNDVLEDFGVDGNDFRDITVLLVLVFSLHIIGMCVLTWRQRPLRISYASRLKSQVVPRANSESEVVAVERV